MEIYTTKILFILTMIVACSLFYFMYLACSHMKNNHWSAYFFMPLVIVFGEFTEKGNAYRKKVLFLFVVLLGLAYSFVIAS